MSRLFEAEIVLTMEPMAERLSQVLPELEGQIADHDAPVGQAIEARPDLVRREQLVGITDVTTAWAEQLS